MKVVFVYFDFMKGTVMITLRNKLPESITFVPFFVLAIVGTAIYTAAVFL